MDIRIYPVSPCNADALLIFGWRNDPITCQNSINPNPKIWDQFREEFYSTYFKNVSLFAELMGRKVGLVYFTHPDCTVSEVGINLEPTARGLGLSKSILKKAIEYLQSRHPCIDIIQAKIKSSNLPSIRLFRSLGFVENPSGAKASRNDFENLSGANENNEQIRNFQLSLVKPDIATSPRSSEPTVSDLIE